MTIIELLALMAAMRAEYAAIPDERDDLHMARLHLEGAIRKVACAVACAADNVRAVTE